MLPSNYLYQPLCAGSVYSRTVQLWSRQFTNLCMCGHVKFVERDVYLRRHLERHHPRPAYYFSGTGRFPVVASHGDGGPGQAFWPYRADYQ